MMFFGKIIFQISICTLALTLAKPVFSQQLDNKKICANRLSINLLGISAENDFLTSANPQQMVDTMLKDLRFIDGFSAFLNSHFNEARGLNQGENAVYYVSKFVLQKQLEFKQIHIGPFNLVEDQEEVKIINDENGMGYWRVKEFRDRYAGNEEEGIMLSTAYQMLHHTIGTDMNAATLPPNGIANESARKENPVCRACHYEGYHALDINASVLPRVQRDEDGNITGYSVLPETKITSVLGGSAMVSNEKEFMNALTNSTDFNYNSCQIAFKFLFGRSETQCESSLFDQCMEAFAKTGKIQSAISIIAKDNLYCQY